MAKPPTKIFISFAGKALIPWVKDFRDRLCKDFGYEREEVYLYTEPHTAPEGASIDPEVAEQLRITEHLVCVISDEYLRSPWCLKEYWHYIQREDRKNGEETIYVITQFLGKLVYTTEAKLKHRISGAVEELKKNKKGDPLPEPILTFATQEWPDILFKGLYTNRNVRLLAENWGDWPTALGLLRTKLIRPRTRGLLDYAALSAYCLGADRYRNGGWGFSLPEEVSRYDDEDGYELPNGPYGLNAVILRALAPIWERAEFTKECNRLFQSTGIRSTFQSAQDRLPDFAGLLACLENPEKALGSLAEEAKTAHTLLNGLDSQSRWTLANLDAAFASPLYLAMVLSCLSKATEISNSNEEYGELLERAGLVNDFKKIQDFKNWVERIIREAQNNSFELLLHAETVNAGKKDLVEFIRAAILWLILGGCLEGQQVLSQVLLSYVNREEQILTYLRNGIRSKDDWEKNMFITVSLALCAATWNCHGSFPSKIQTLLYDELFQKIRPSRIVPKLNCAGWSAILLIAFNDAQQILISNLALLKQLWSYGVSLRSERLEVVGEDTKAEFLKELLRNLKMNSLQEHAAWWVNNIPFLPRGARLSAEEQQKDFIEALASATFWGPKLNISDSPSRTLSGVLLVNISKNGTRTNTRILLDSEGYRRMFLHPFSLITEMNVLNLHDIRGEFGDDDKELVRIMGETVVLETFVRAEEKNGYVPCEAGFITRTQQITDALTGAKWPLENGMDDILKVRTGPNTEETRWIYRSAVLQAREGSPERIMAWRFVEMPSIVERLILKSGQAA
jgi:hypothetical protein